MTDFAIDRHWLLSEHKIKNGMALLSGTTFVELARAAFSVGKAPGPIEINDLTFLTPFQVAEGTTRRLVIQIAAEGGASEITMRTAGDDARTLPHVIGDVRCLRRRAPRRSTSTRSSLVVRPSQRAARRRGRSVFRRLRPSMGEPQVGSLRQTRGAAGAGARSRSSRRTWSTTCCIRPCSTSRPAALSGSFPVSIPTPISTCPWCTAGCVCSTACPSGSSATCGCGPSRATARPSSTSR